MDLDMTVTEIKRVIFVSKEEYPEEVSRFSANLSCNELVYQFSGEYVLKLGENIIDCRPGLIRVMAKGDHGKYELRRKTHGDCVDVFFYTEKPLDEMLFYGDYSSNRQLEELFRRVFSVWVTKHAGYRAECMSILYKILSLMQQKKEYVDPNRAEKIRPAIAYIEENFNKEEISCEKLAGTCGISYSYLKQLFLKRFHRSPKQYVMHLRLNCACDLLLSGRYSVGQAAEMSGFTDLCYFSKFFKKTVGISPSEYRKKYRSSK